MIAMSKVGANVVEDISGLAAGVPVGSSNVALPRASATIRVIDANDPGSVLADVALGMTVLGSSLERLGTVARIFTGVTGEPVALAVSYGLRGRKQKYVLGEFVDLVDDERVVLSFDHHQFKSLRDIGE
jgi:hypothetical protein